MSKAVIIDGVRTAIGRFMGTLSATPAPKLGAEVVKGLIARTKVDPEQLDEVIMGNVLQAGQYQNPARQAAIYGGVPTSVGAYTVNKVCGSGLKSVMLAATEIRAGDADLIIAGGMENMSNAPYLLEKARTGYRLGDGKLIDSMVHDGLWDVYNNFHMGNTGELVAEKYNVTREDQDQFAANSQRKAAAAVESGAFKDEIIPVEIPQRKGDPVLFDTDEGPRGDTTAEKLGKLRPVFKKDGTVTAGNASTINDGAAAVLVASEEKAKELGLPVMATIEDYATGGMDPEWVMMAPLEAVRKLNEKTGKNIDDYDLIELNEAFSSQGVALIRELKLDPEKLNVNGGAVALGHPIGASGCRILVTLLYAMKNRGARTGLCSLCLGGGEAVAMSVTM